MSSTIKNKLLLLAGEESGIVYASEIAAEMTRRVGGVEIRGYGDYGFRTHDLAVMGFAAVVKKLFFFLRVERTMKRAIDEWRPNVVCTIDYPGMNLKLAAYAKARGVKAVHVVSPQVWAWKAGRIPKIERALDKLCCFFPFEPALYRKGFATFVGHPLVDAFHPCAREKGSESAHKVLALLPGSRLGEIQRHLPTMLAAARELEAEIIIPAANERAYAAIAAQLETSGVRATLRLGGAREVLLGADAAIVASGTATLEAALANCPTVLVYRVSAPLAWFARRVIRGVKHVGLINVVAEKAGVPCPMPELLQEDFTAANILKVLAPWLHDKQAAEVARADLAQTVALLKSDGTSIAKIVQFLI